MGTKCHSRFAKCSFLCEKHWKAILPNFCWFPPEFYTFIFWRSKRYFLIDMWCRRMATMPLAMGEPGKRLRILTLGRTSCRWLFSADSWVPAKQLYSSTSWRPSTPKRTSGVTTNKTILSRQPNKMILEERSFSTTNFCLSCNSFCSPLFPK